MRNRSTAFQCHSDRSDDSLRKSVDSRLSRQATQRGSLALDGTGWKRVGLDAPSPQHGYSRKFAAATDEVPSIGSRHPLTIGFARMFRVGASSWRRDAILER